MNGLAVLSVVGRLFDGLRVFTELVTGHSYLLTEREQETLTASIGFRFADFGGPQRPLDPVLTIDRRIQSLRFSTLVFGGDLLAWRFESSRRGARASHDDRQSAIPEQFLRISVRSFDLGEGNIDKADA